MVAIKLDETYTLSSNKRCWTVSKAVQSKNKFGELITKEKGVLFCTDLGNALNAYLQLKQYESDCKDFKELVGVTNKALETIKTITKEIPGK